MIFVKKTVQLCYTVIKTVAGLRISVIRPFYMLHRGV